MLTGMNLISPSDYSARYLVVDPHPAIRLLLCAALSDQCAHFDAAASFVEAQALLAKGAFTAILCENHLPDASGLRLYREVRRMFPVVPFVMICGGHPVSLPDPKFRFLAKPFRLAQLEETMAEVTGPHEIIPPPRCGSLK